ncbi:hypothetical protein GRF29_164g597818 [Pseudopithomyces chartarum]|uniref:Uncharacterized protein n=1 Tax=Pseudopithomyces chartarum TaxID=1892770 RepID=A0AAN6LS30_9PLEO|nr:hypothetical protein GRF29_164g597818 [Pseudopithomyces chartarum]
MDFNPTVRHSGAYVAPCFYQDSNHSLQTNGVMPSHEFGLTTYGGDTPGWRPEDGDRVTLREACYLRDTYGKSKSRSQERFDFTARAMVARPLTRLTIRMSRVDWWTWTDDPETTDNEEKLALDPACGRTTRPLVTDMLRLAEQRRNGQHPQYAEGTRESDWTWGAAISMLSDLKTFELVLETFSEKRKQLEVVVDCAKTWKFPLNDTQHELSYDGKVEVLTWSRANSGWVTEFRSETADMDLDDDADSPNGLDNRFEKLSEAQNLQDIVQRLTVQHP